MPSKTLYLLKLLLPFQKVSEAKQENEKDPSNLVAVINFINYYSEREGTEPQSVFGKLIGTNSWSEEDALKSFLC